MSLIEELKRRKVFKVGAAYLVVAWLAVQAASIGFPAFDAPSWALRVFILVALLGFPVAVVMAWVFESTPDGVKLDTRVAGSKGVFAGAIVLVVLMLGWYFQGLPAFRKTDVAQGTATRHAPGVDSRSIAVLPFENLSADANNAYFADGMQDLILTKLADVRDLRVISRTSTKAYGSRPTNLKRIGEELGVASLLEGSVQKVGDQVLINVQLIDARTDRHLWAESYQRTLDNIFGVEGEVAGKIADVLKAKLSASAAAAVAKAPTTHPRAYALYLQANAEIDQFFQGDAKAEHAEKAVALLEQAVADDPEFALAWARLSGMQSSLVLNQMRDTPELRAAAVVNAQKALALQPDLAQAHSALAATLMSKGDRTRALEQYLAARNLAPGDARIAELLAANYMALGQFEQAATEIARAIELDPRNTHLYQWSCFIGASMGRYDTAIAVGRQGLAINPQDAATRGITGAALLANGQVEEGLKEMATAGEQNPAFKLGAIATSLDYGADAEAVLSAMDRLAPDSDPAAGAGYREFIISRAELALGRTAQAKAHLDDAHSLILHAVESQPNSPQLHGALAAILALLGDRTGAIHAADRALALVGDDALRKPNTLVAKAAVLAHFGDGASAAAILDQVMTAGGGGVAISPATLRLDRTWDPIRATPAFVHLLEKYPWAGPAYGTNAD